MESSSYVDARVVKIKLYFEVLLIVSKITEVLALKYKRERGIFRGADAIEFGVLCERSASVRIEIGSMGLIISIVM